MSPRKTQNVILPEIKKINHRKGRTIKEHQFKTKTGDIFATKKVDN